MKEFAVAAAGSNTADLFPSIKFLQLIAGVKSQVEKIHQQADKIISNIIEERETRLKTGKSEEDGDLVDVLLRDQENGNLQFPMTVKTIKAVIFVIIFSLHLNLMLQSISLPIRKLKIR